MRISLQVKEMGSLASVFRVPACLSKCRMLLIIRGKAIKENRLNRIFLFKHWDGLIIALRDRDKSRKMRLWTY